MEFIQPSANTFTIYTKSGCSNCNKVKKLILNYNDSEIPLIINCDEYLIEDKEEFLEIIKNLSKKEHKTFPIVFYKKKYIGGYKETEKYCDTMVQPFSFNNELF